MKYTKLLALAVIHEFIYGTKRIWKEHFNECVIFIMIMIIHLICSLFLGSQKEARIAFTASLGFVNLLLMFIVFFSGQRTIMFSFWFTIWYLLATYSCHHPFYLY